MEDPEHTAWVAADERHEEHRERGGHNRIDYRNVDEDAAHDESGSQGPGRGDPPQREQ
jgi:hypothetical protein